MRTRWPDRKSKQWWNEGFDNFAELAKFSGSRIFCYIRSSASHWAWGYLHGYRLSWTLLEALRKKCAQTDFGELISAFLHDLSSGASKSWYTYVSRCSLPCRSTSPGLFPRDCELSVCALPIAPRLLSRRVIIKILFVQSLYIARLHTRN